MSIESTREHDYSQVETTARVALYDDFASSPRITKINPAETTIFIENLTVAIYEQSKLAGGSIPYSVIREVAENFIHARFREIVVSILDSGNTIRFADQGPGIQEKERAQQPGFSSAIEPMKDYIRGVGSGFPIVRDYLNSKNGSISIEDNLTTGAVVTISLTPHEHQASHLKQVSSQKSPHIQTPFIPKVVLNQREQTFLTLLAKEGTLRVTDLAQYTDTIPATTFNTLERLKEKGLVEITANKKRQLTELGRLVVQELE